MASFDEEIRLDEEENRRELAYIRTQLPSDVKKFYSDKDILYMSVFHRTGRPGLPGTECLRNKG